MRQAIALDRGHHLPRLEAENAVVYPCEREGDRGAGDVHRNFPTANGRARLCGDIIRRPNADAEYPDVLITGTPAEGGIGTRAA